MIYHVLTMARVRTVEWAIGAGVTGGAWDVKLHRYVWDEDVYLIGAHFSVCSPGQSVQVRISKGVSDPTLDVLATDCYFQLTSHQGGMVAAGAGGSSEGSIMLPAGYYFPINEDEPIFMDIFAENAGDGGHLILYYVLKRDWKKKG